MEQLKFIPKTRSEKIDELMHRLGCFEQQEFARLVGVSPATVSFWRNNNRKPSVEDMSRIARLTGLPLEKIYETFDITA